MAIFTWPVLSKLVFCALSFYGVYCVYWDFTVGALCRRLSQENHCQSVTKHASNRPILGLDVMWQTYKRWKNHMALDYGRDRFISLKINTFQMRILGNRFIFTTEPENLKTILSLNFKSWGLGEDRRKAFEP